MAIPGVWVQCGPSNTYSGIYIWLFLNTVFDKSRKKGTKVRKANMAVIIHWSQGIAMVTGLPHTGNLDKTCQRLSCFTLSVRKPRSEAVLNHREQSQCLCKRWTEAWRHWSRPQGRMTGWSWGHVVLCSNEREEWCLLVAFTERWTDPRHKQVWSL